MSSNFPASAHDRMAQQHIHHHHHQQHHHMQHVNHQPPPRYMSPLRRHHSHGAAVPSSTFYPPQQPHPHHHLPPPHQNDHPNLHRAPNHQQQHPINQGQQQQQPYMMNCYPNTNGWAGVPLISTAVRRPRKHMLNTSLPNQHAMPNAGSAQRPNIDRNSSLDFDEGAMLRLAAHAHGAPLILSGRQQRPKGINAPNYNTKHHHNLGNKSYFNPTHINHNQLMPKQFVQPDCDGHFNPNTPSHSTKLDTALASVAPPTNSHHEQNEDSSGSQSNVATASGMAEMCLPRIIKPRKRRKKDRKPLLAGNESSSQVTDADEDSSPQYTTSNHFNGASTQYHQHDNPQEIQSYGLTAANFNGAPKQTQQQLYAASASSSADLSQQSSDSEPTSSCSCRLCDPSGRIWAFPLRRSCSDQTDAELAARRKSIGVIGGNRPSSARRRSEWHSTSLDKPLSEFGSTSRKGSFSDSGDSGCDILSGLSFCDDLLLSPSPPHSANDVMLEPFRFPDTAAVFSDSINEISRKMMDVMELRSCSTGSSGSDEDAIGSSGFGDIADGRASMFSDEFLLSLEAASSLSLLDVAEQAERAWIMKTTPSTPTFATHRAGDEQPIHCFDIVWNASQMLPIQELR